MEREWIRHLRDHGSVDSLELELFAWYLSESDALVTRLESAEVAYLSDQVASGDVEPNDSGLVAVTYYSRRVRYSHVIYLTSMLESIMKRACERVILTLGEQGAPFSPSELKGDPWAVKKKALERYGHFKVSNALWKPVHNLIRVRNVLVHDNGVLCGASARTVESLSALPGIRIDSGEIVIESEFVANAFDAVSAFAAYLDRDVRDIIDRRLRPRSLT